jgi:hypothetical protein
MVVAAILLAFVGYECFQWYYQIKSYEQFKRGGAATRGLFAASIVLIGMGLIAAVLISAAGWIVFGSLQELRTLPVTDLTHERREALNRVTELLSRVVPAEQIRFEVRRQQTLIAYIPNHPFEAVVYPDRRELVTQVGARWCKGASLAEMPVLEIRSTLDANILARYSCALKRTQLGRFFWQ